MLFAVIKNMHIARKLPSCVAVYGLQNAQILALVRLQWYEFARNCVLSLLGDV